MITCYYKNYFNASLRHIVVDALVIKDQRILLVKRAGKWLESGKWALPGGFMERNETAIQATLREIQEETGYRVKIIKLLKISDTPRRRHEDRQNISFIYLARPVKKVSEFDDEVSEIKWFFLNHLPDEKNMAFDHLKTIKACYSLC